jgi:hypothetical protein
MGAYDFCEVVYMASINRRDFIRVATGALTLLSTSRALPETTYIARGKAPLFSGVPGYSLTQGFSLDGVTRTENSIVLSEKAINTIKAGYRNTGIWWNAHRNAEAFRIRLSNQISAYEKYKLPGWFEEGTGAFANFTDLLDHLVKAGRFAEEVKIGLPPLLRVTALALSLGVYLEDVSLEVVEFLNGIEDAKRKLGYMQLWATTGFIAQSLEFQGSNLVEKVYFQEHDGGRVHQLWECSYMLPTGQFRG